MHRRTTTAAVSLALLLTTALAACSSSEDEEAAPSSPTAEEPPGEIPSSGWWCRLIKQDAVDAASGGRSAEARQVTVTDEADHWACEVWVPDEDGEPETVLTLSVQGNAAAEADEALGEVQGLEGAEPGPDHLGVSYFAPTLGVSVIPCFGPPETPESDTEVPYLLMSRAPLDTEGAATELLQEPLTRLARELDQGYGCSPSKINPRDDASTTTAP